MPKHVWILAVWMLSACDASFTPRPKAAASAPIAGTAVKPYPCPDWSSPHGRNYRNANHSNFGCATQTNTAAQLAYPQDLLEGHGDDAPDTAITTKVVEDYRAGKLPLPLTPIQTSTTGQ